MPFNALLALAAVICIAMRIVPGLVMRKVNLSTDAQRFMRFIPITVFAVMICLDIFYWQAHFCLNPLVNWKLLAALVSVGASYWTKNIIWTILLGTLTLVILMAAF